MKTIEMKQGTSFPILFDLFLDENILTPDLVEDVELCAGEDIRRTLSGGGVMFAEEEQAWWFRPTQAETLAMEPGHYRVEASVKFLNGYRETVRLGRLTILDAISEEEL